jgi:acetolactate synthase-1/3 small subunit
MSRHTLSVLVENKSGVLARVSALFSRRGFNIESLAVGPTENADLSRMTIVVEAASQPLEQITKQLNKLIEVIKIVELDGGAAVQRELLMVKVRAPMPERTQVLQTAELFRARVVDVNTETVTLEATGTPDKLQALLAVLTPLGIKEMARPAPWPWGGARGRCRAPVRCARSSAPPEKGPPPPTAGRLAQDPCQGVTTPRSRSD